MTIETNNLRLRLYSREDLLAKFNGMPGVSPEWIARIRASSVPDPWTYGYEIVLQHNGTTIGSAGFKGPPDVDGVVEIAYGIEPEYQGRGYATEAAEGLVDLPLATTACAWFERTHFQRGGRRCACWKSAGLDLWAKS